MPRKRIIRPCSRTIAYALMALAATASVASAQDPETGGFSPDSATEPTAMRVAAPPTADVYGATAPRVKRFACRTGVRLRRHRAPGLARARVREGPEEPRRGPLLRRRHRRGRRRRGRPAQGRPPLRARPRPARGGHRPDRPAPRRRHPLPRLQGHADDRPGRREAARRRRRRRGPGAEGLLRLAQARLALLRRRREPAGEREHPAAARRRRRGGHELVRGGGRARRGRRPSSGTARCAARSPARASTASQ